MIRVPPAEELLSLSTLKKEENLRFKSFLKGHPWSDERLDSEVRRIIGDPAFIDCRDCGHCCRTLYVSLTEEDTERLAASAGMAAEEFKSRYLADMRGRDQDIFRERPCPFQQGNLCVHYEARPENCRSYPHLQNEGFRHRLYNVFDSYAVCPIVYFTVEALKRELGFPAGDRP